VVSTCSLGTLRLRIRPRAIWPKRRLAVAMEAAGVGPSDIDFIALGTTTPDQVFPNTACLVQARLGIAGRACDPGGGGLYWLSFTALRASPTNSFALSEAKCALGHRRECLSRLVDLTIAPRACCSAMAPARSSSGLPSNRGSFLPICMRMVRTQICCSIQQGRRACTTPGVSRQNAIHMQGAEVSRRPWQCWRESSRRPRDSLKN